MDTEGWKPAVANGFLFFLLVGLSATVDFSHFRSQLSNKKAIITGLVLQFLILPFLGFAVVKALRLDNSTSVMMLIITSSPGGAYSNLFCSVFNADLALSVTMTAISTILSLGMLPLNVFFYSQFAIDSDILNSLDWRALGISLGVVVAAISIGLFLSYHYNNKRFHDIANKIGNLSGLGLIIFSTVASEGFSISGRPVLFYVGTSLPIVLGLLISVILSTIMKLEKPERVTISIECCYQNTAVAITSCLSLFAGEELKRALGVPLFYTGMQSLIVGTFCLFSWKLGWTKAPANEKFLKVLFHTYEESHGEDPGGTDIESMSQHGEPETKADDEQQETNETKVKEGKSAAASVK
jgi:predicted Na+-dependent transporter